MPRILIVEDHAIVRKGIALILESPCLGASCDGAGDAREAEEKIAAGSYDLVLLDISIPGGNGLDLLQKLHKKRPELPILMLSMYPEDQYARRALAFGAAGYLTKESAPDELVVAVQKILAGGRYVSASLADLLALHLGSRWSTETQPHERLSDREFQILVMFGEGKTATEIADLLCISIKTVSTYRTRVMQKTGLANNAQMMGYALRNNLAY